MTGSVLFVLVFHSSCYFDVIIPETAKDTEAVSFGNDIQPILNSVCVSCHNGVVAVVDLQPGQSYFSLIQGGYINVLSPVESDLINKLKENHPFSGAVTDSEMELILQWIAEGGANN